MIESSFFRMSVLSAGLAVRRQQANQYAASSSEAIRQLQAGSARVAYLDYDMAETFANSFGWEVFTPGVDRQEELQITLLNMALAQQPFWAKMSTFGRDRIRRIVDQNALQCLEAAGLFVSPPSPAVVKWWDTLSQVARENIASSNSETGRAGELLTLQHENKRLREIGLEDRIPLWKSVEDNTAGYDVLSYDLDSEGIVRELYIEVKASNTIPNRFFLTRGEWETALDKAPTYLFHLWDLSNEDLLICKVEQVKGHVSNDQGQGRWDIIELPFSVCG